MVLGRFNSTRSSGIWFLFILVFSHPQLVLACKVKADALAPCPHSTGEREKAVSFLKGMTQGYSNHDGHSLLKGTLGHNCLLCG